MIAKGSIAKSNSRGLKGHPCRVPRERGKKLDVTLLVRTDACGAAYKIVTQEQKTEPNPNFCNPVNKKLCSILSNGFCALREINTSGSGLLCLIEYIEDTSYITGYLPASYKARLIRVNKFGKYTFKSAS